MAGQQMLTPGALEFIRRTLGAEAGELRDITATKAGMTNRSFRFSYGDGTYILRVPGEGTDKLINRRFEAENYRALNGDPISDHVLAIDPDSGYKLTEYWAGTHNCDPENDQEVRRCLALLKEFHQKDLQVAHRFYLYEEIELYEALRQGPSEYPDYDQVRKRCFALRPFLRSLDKPDCLSHIDAVPDNFLFVPTPAGEDIHLIDWEYAGMYDPHVDIAMFAIYAGYGRQRLDWLMDVYFGGPTPAQTRRKIYCYVALGGMLWSNWCEYKKKLGVDFGDYARGQYRYAAEYSRLAMDGGEGA